MDVEVSYKQTVHMTEKYIVKFRYVGDPTGLAKNREVFMYSYRVDAHDSCRFKFIKDFEGVLWPFEIISVTRE